MAQVNLLVENVTSTLRSRVRRRERNACQKFCDRIPFLVCPCTISGLLDLLSGNIHTYVLSLFSILGVCGLFYCVLFGWNSTLMDGMLAISFVGPLWVTFTIAPKAEFTGLRTGLMHEIEHLQHTNRALQKRFGKIRKNYANLQRATTKVKKKSKLRSWTAEKSTAISRRLKKEDKKITHHVGKLKKRVKNIQRSVMSLPRMITEFERRVEQYLTTQMTLEYADENFADEQKDIGFLKELKHIPRRLEASMCGMEYFEGCYTDAGIFAKEQVAPVLENMQAEWNRFSALVRQQELSFCRMLAYNIQERSDYNRFGNEEWIIFVDRLPTHLADVVILDDLKFNKYTTSRTGLPRQSRACVPRQSRAGGPRHIGPAGLRRLIEDIVDGVEKIDQIPEKAGLTNFSRVLSEDIPSRRPKLLLRRIWTV